MGCVSSKPSEVGVVPPSSSGSDASVGKSSQKGGATTGGPRTAETTRVGMGSSNSTNSLTIQTGVHQPAEVSQQQQGQPSPQTSTQRPLGADPTSDALPASSLAATNQRSSLMLPGSSLDDPFGTSSTSAFGTASARKRSSMKPTDGTKREIPPKSPTVPRKMTHGTSGQMLDAAAFPHASNAGGSNAGVSAHAGHHGYGPGNLAGEPADAIDPDASTQKISSDTDASAANAGGHTRDGPLDAVGLLPGHSDRHAHGSNASIGGLGSHKGKKRLRRQTSHKGLLSRLALQFPSIRASFQKVHNVFERYHQERVRELMAQQQQQQQTNGTSTATATVTASTSSSSAATANTASSPSPPHTAATSATNKISDFTPPPAQLSSTEASLLQSKQPSGPEFKTPEQAVAAASSSTSASTTSSSSSSGTDGTAALMQQHEHTKKKLTQQYMKEEISLDKLTEVLHHIAGPTKTFTPDEVRALFQLADLDGSKTISFREFLICVSIGYFLKMPAVEDGADGVHTPAADGTTRSRAASSSASVGADDFVEIQKGFRMVEKAFRDIDEDNSQSIDVGELKRALFATTQVKDQTLLELRFAEMDFNSDGDINFPEFLYGMVSWVTWDGDEDEPAASPSPVPSKK